MSDYLMVFVCPNCGYEYYTDTESLPGGEEHCEYCPECSSPLVSNCQPTPARDDGD
jgi:hypothetical protein